MNSKHVDIYIGKLNDFLNRKQHDFPDFRTFNEYKKQQIQLIKNKTVTNILKDNKNRLIDINLNSCRITMQKYKNCAV